MEGECDRVLMVWYLEVIMTIYFCYLIPWSNMQSVLSFFIFYTILLPYSGPKKAPALQVVSVQSTDIPPKENVTYAKQTQTTATGVSELRDGKTFIHVAGKLCELFSFFLFWQITKKVKIIIYRLIILFAPMIINFKIFKYTCVHNV